ncbi:MAG: SDR family oxidoreductase [Planctomycetota bacterium]
MGVRLEQRVAVVTGASSGIGRAIALGFAGEGAAVALLARREARLHDVANGIARAGGRALAIGCDVTDVRQVEAARDRVLGAWTRVDVLVNAAGVLHAPALLHEIDPSVWEATIAVNLRGPYLRAAASVPAMIAGRFGRIINSTSGYKHQPSYGPYSITKSALDAMTCVLAQELQSMNILVNALDPGYVRTEMAPAAWRCRTPSCRARSISPR